VRDLYKVLGIASTADDRRIKTAFRRRAKAFHPDLHPGDSRAEERFKELTEAYEVLRSAHARACYDAYRAQRRRTVRRRVATSAAMMAGSFVLTLSSAFTVLAVHDAGMPGRDGWQLPRFVESVADRVAEALGRPASRQADEWTKGTSVALARTSETDIAKDSPQAAPGETRTPPDGQAKAETPVHARAQKKPAAASRPPRPTAPTGTERKESAVQSAVAIGDDRRPWPADEPLMGLGATTR
jgi:curved DNA-binding protein CbpA